MKKLFKHLKTVRIHRKYVRKVCFKMGIPWQGLVHDLSKYSITELKIAKYYVGTRSPHAVCREINGYSPSWMHHYQRNKHHWQFHIDAEDWPNKVIPVKIPYKYVIEMFADFVGAGKAYKKDVWTTAAPWEYWVAACEGKRLMHKDSEALIKILLYNMLELKSEEAFYFWYKRAKKQLKADYENSTLDRWENKK